jgi:hypothetical protein
VSARGLVVGYVQSGKTAHFTALISKAADVGYRLFIVLSGITDALRNQTQERLDREVVELNLEQWFKLTSHGEDFRQHSNANAMLASYGRRVIAVVKKNAMRLRRLRNWLRTARQEVLRSCPILLIDDEADQASVNSARDPERRTAINELLVELLGMAPKIAYVGYTATPFANVLIDPSSPDDLYPRDFIMHLPQPADYFGPEQLFGRDPINWDTADRGADGLDMIRTVPEDEAAQLRPAAGREFRPSITPALLAALRYFWMATAARHARGQQNDHSTMLIHTSQRIEVHERLAAPLEDCRRSIAAEISTGSPALLGALRRQWDEELSRVPPESVGRALVPFETLHPHLLDVVQRTTVQIENSRSQERIDYRVPGRIYVVVGGNVLSRGLTLEGLTVSFFLRTASAYDTLLQTGRWFGFRRGYEDLPRVWMTDELKGYFYDLATVEKEIRYDIDRYRGGTFTPKDFGVRIKTHPQLAITSSLKMQHAVRAALTYAGTSEQTIVFAYQDEIWLRGNYQAAQDLVRGLRRDGLQPTRIADRPSIFLRGASASRILEFLEKYRIHELLLDMQADLIRDYIRLENSKGRLHNWNVGVVTLNEPLHGLVDLGFEEPVPLIRRSRFNRPRPPGAADIKALMSALDDGLDLDLPSATLAKMSREELRAKRDEMLQDTGLFLLYPIYRNSQPRPGKESMRLPLGAAFDVMGLAMVFPGGREAAKVEYMTADLSRVPKEEPEFEDEEQVA